MIDLSFRKYLEEADPKKEDKPEFQDMASKLLGIDPEDRKGVYLGADVQDGGMAWNIVPMVMGDPTYDKYGKITGNKMKLMTHLPGQRMMRRYSMQGKKWVDMGREDSANKKSWLPVDIIDKWINQGAENGSQGGAGGGMPGGGVPGL